jgi:hypothetical protein
MVVLLKICTLSDAALREMSRYIRQVEPLASKGLALPPGTELSEHQCCKLYLYAS